MWFLKLYDSVINTMNKINLQNCGKCKVWNNFFSYAYNVKTSMTGEFF